MAYPPPDGTPHPNAPGCFYNESVDEYICDVQTTGEPGSRTSRSTSINTPGFYFIDRTDYWPDGNYYGSAPGSAGQIYSPPGQPNESGLLVPPEPGGGGASTRAGTDQVSRPSAGWQNIFDDPNSPPGPGGLGLFDLPSFQIPSWLWIAAAVVLGIGIIGSHEKKHHRR